MVGSDLCDYSDVYIFVKRDTDPLADAASENNKAKKDVALKRNVLLRSCIYDI